MFLQASNVENVFMRKNGKYIYTNRINNFVAQQVLRGFPHGVVANALDGDIVVRELEL